jgi:cephalosporin hydroxylase
MLPGLPSWEATLHPVKIAHAAVHEHHALQKPGELAGFLAVLMDDPPDVVVEVGSDAGGTLWAWQQLGARRVIGVSLPGAGFSSGAHLETTAEVVHGDSHDEATLGKLEALLAGDDVDLLFIDGDHTYDGVRRDYQMYSQLVRPDGIVAFHDICNHPGMPHVAVDLLWRQLRFPDPKAKQEIVTDPPTWGGIGWFHMASQVWIDALDEVTA